MVDSFDAPDPISWERILNLEQLYTGRVCIVFGMEMFCKWIEAQISAGT